MGVLKRVSGYLWPVVALATVLVLAWMGRERIRDAAVLPGSRAPNFSLPALDRGDLELSDLRDQVVLINIWATWCPPCRWEMPSMQRLYESIDSDDFEILAISIDAEEGSLSGDGHRGGNVRAFVDEYGLTFPILHDPSGRIQRTYRTMGVPESFLVGRDGVIREKWPGALEWDTPEMEALIRRLLDSED